MTIKKRDEYWKIAQENGTVLENSTGKWNGACRIALIICTAL
jgi:hypothetical protein